MNDAPDLAAVTAGQQQTWSEGDFAMVAAPGPMSPSEALAEALDIVPDERVLDVACGSGNGAIAAARRTWGNAVGADFVPALLERGRERAAAERLEVEFVEADAQELPFEDGELRRRDVDLRRDVRPRPAEDRGRAAAGGQARRPDRDGQLDARTAPSARCSQTIAKHAAPPPGLDAAGALGHRGARARAVRRRDHRAAGRAPASRQPFRSADHYLEFFRDLLRPDQDRLRTGRRRGRGGAQADLTSFLERRTPRATARWCSSPSTCRWSRPAPRRLRTSAARTRIVAPIKQHAEEDEAGDGAALAEPA